MNFKISAKNTNLNQFMFAPARHNINYFLMSHFSCGEVYGSARLWNGH